ncbi:MAG TPA: aminotransferase class IV [Sphingobacteriaceae bacterium]
MTYAYLNTDFTDAAKAVLPVGDLAIQRGYGVFDFLKVDRGVPLFFQDHMDRFVASAAKLDLPLRPDREELRSVIHELVRRNQLDLSGIRLTLTGGVSPDGYQIAEPNLIITQLPLKERDPGLVGRGLKLITYPYLRQLPDVKTIDYIMAIRLQRVIREMQVDDVLYQHDGLVSECPRTNFFIVTGQQEVRTADSAILEGVTRKKVLEIARTVYPVIAGPLHTDEIRSASEAFITSTTKGVLPVTEVDGLPVGDGRPGPVTRYLDSELSALKEEYIVAYKAAYR